VGEEGSTTHLHASMMGTSDAASAVPRRMTSEQRRGEAGREARGRVRRTLRAPSSQPPENAGNRRRRRGGEGGERRAGEIGRVPSTGPPEEASNRRHRRRRGERRLGRWGWGWGRWEARFLSVLPREEMGDAGREEWSRRHLPTPKRPTNSHNASGKCPQRTG
jgi:hypothetical protein